MANGPIWKVPYSNKGRFVDSTVEEVQAALPSDVEGLTVDDGLRIVCVRFPSNVSNETMQKVKQHLQDQGFSAVY
jgi:hypothetical protein